MNVQYQKSWKLLGFPNHPVAFLCGSLHVLPGSAWVLSQYPGFLPQSKDTLWGLGLCGGLMADFVVVRGCQRGWLFVSYVSLAIDV